MVPVSCLCFSTSIAGCSTTFVAVTFMPLHLIRTAVLFRQWVKHLKGEI
jgi:hypothetical protein